MEGRRDHALEEPTSLNALSLLPRLAAIGVRAIKIEGRQRSPAYVAQVVAYPARRAGRRQAAPARYQPHPDWHTLARHAEGSQTTLGAFDRPWK